MCRVNIENLIHKICLLHEFLNFGLSCINVNNLEVSTVGLSKISLVEAELCLI